jgi:hypothetical protein
VSVLFDVDVPQKPPAAYAPMSWSSVRKLEGLGLSFGPHSRSHPILPNTNDEDAHDEIVGSWLDVQRECKTPVPVFCYPNGSHGDREKSIVRGCGLLAALTVGEGYLNLRAKHHDLWSIPRFPFADAPTENSFRLSGLARSAPKGLGCGIVGCEGLEMLTTLSEFVVR